MNTPAMHVTTVGLSSFRGVGDFKAPQGEAIYQGQLHVDGLVYRITVEVVGEPLNKLASIPTALDVVIEEVERGAN